MSQGLCLAAGVGLAAWALVGGLGAYSTSLLSAQVAQVLVLMILVPALLAKGLPSPRLAALLDRGRRRRVGLLLQPTNAAVLAVLVLAATFQTPLLDALAEQRARSPARRPGRPRLRLAWWSCRWSPNAPVPRDRSPACC